MSRIGGPIASRARTHREVCMSPARRIWRSLGTPCLRNPDSRAGADSRPPVFSLPFLLARAGQLLSATLPSVVLYSRLDRGFRPRDRLGFGLSGFGTTFTNDSGPFRLR